MSKTTAAKLAAEAKAAEERKFSFLVSIKRTLVPIVVGAVAASFLGEYVDIASLERVLSGVISAVYYLVIRFLETKVPSAGVLLGSKAQPTYEVPPAE